MASLSERCFEYEYTWDKLFKLLSILFPGPLALYQIRALGNLTKRGRYKVYIGRKWSDRCISIYPCDRPAPIGGIDWPFNKLSKFRTDCLAYIEICNKEAFYQVWGRFYKANGIKVNYWGAQLSSDKLPRMIREIIRRS